MNFIRVVMPKIPRKLSAIAMCGVALIFLGGASYLAVQEDAELKEAFGLTAVQEVSLVFDRTPGVPVMIDVPIDDIEYTLDLQPHTARAENFVFLVQVADGSYEERDPGESRLLRGTVQGVPGSIVVGSMLDTGLAAHIDMGDGRMYFIEPTLTRMTVQDPWSHVIYRNTDTAPHGGVCGVTDEAAPIRFAEGGGEATAGATLPQVAEIACDADVEYFNDYGNETAVRNRIELIIGIMNHQYQRDVDIIHLITTIIVRTSEPDPYSSTNASILLDQFTNHWRNNHSGIQRDVAQLFTGKSLQGGTIGIAWLSAICSNSFGYNVVESDFNNNLSCATDLNAHELGHNWSADHCSCTQHTMNPFITCANQFHPSFSIPEIVNYRNSRFCLDDFGTLSLPVCDEIPQQFIDQFIWRNSDGVIATTNGVNEPSPPYSAVLDRTDILESQPMDTLSIPGTIKFSFHLQERFAEAGDFFFAEYLDNGGNWVPVYSQEGDENGNQDVFDYHEFTLGNDAKHMGFKVRFRSSGNTSDNWHVDDICVEEGGTDSLCADGGTLLEGAGQVNDFNATCGSDDVYWAAHGATLFYAVSDPVVQFELTTTAPSGFGGSNITVDIEASRQQANSFLFVRVDLFNFATGDWVALPGLMILEENDTTQNFALPAGAVPTDFVENGTDLVRLRLQTIQTDGLPTSRTQLDEVIFNFVQ